MWASRPLRVALFAFFLVASADRRALAQGTAQVPLPPGIGRHDVAHADGALRTLLARHAEGWLATHAHAQSGSGDVVVLIDADGTPILPDLEAAASGAGRLTAVGAELTFTFDSPDAPWTGAEIQRMQGILRLCQRRAKVVYGPPFFANVVNVRRIDFPGFTGGIYDLTQNEMALGEVAADVLCHEMIHAFRDDAILGLPSFEEGMTRAAEVQVFNRMTSLVHPFDERHSHVYDVFYEAMDTPVIGSPFGNFFQGYVGVLTRYQLAGYAWWKAWLENPAFFAEFNQALYAAILVDPSVTNSEAALHAIAAGVQAEVEALPFSAWYARQGVLDTAPPTGYLLYPRITSADFGTVTFTLDFFERLASGQEIMQAGAPIDWAVYDHAEVLRASGSGLTSANGFVQVQPALPPGYRGRIRLVGTATAPGGSATLDAFEYWGEAIGVFGIVTGADDGTVSIMPVGHGYARTVPVVNGAFAVEGLRHRKGAYDARFTGPAGETVVRRFDKDASNYFLLLEPAP